MRALDTMWNPRLHEHDIRSLADHNRIVNSDTCAHGDVKSSCVKDLSRMTVKLYTNLCNQDSIIFISLPWELVQLLHAHIATWCLTHPLFVVITSFT